MSEKFKNISIFILSALCLLLLLVSGVMWVTRDRGGEKIEVVMGETAIIQRVQELNEMRTIEETIQTDMEIELDLGDFKILNFSLFQNKKKQQIEVTGKVTGGVDLSGINEENSEVDEENRKIKMTLPAPEILSVELIPDKTRILDEDLSILLKTRSAVSAELEEEINNKMFQNANEQGKDILVKLACEDEILEKSKEKARDNLTQIFRVAGYEEVDIQFEEVEECNYDPNGE